MNYIAGCLTVRMKIENTVRPHYFGLIVGKPLFNSVEARITEVRPGGHVGFVVDKAALGQVLSEYFGFPC
jgi:hypothetical protein